MYAFFFHSRKKYFEFYKLCEMFMGKKKVVLECEDHMD
jgi:hypothetical protein